MQYDPETLRRLQLALLEMLHEINGRLPLPKRNGEYRALMAALDNAGGDHVVVNTRF